MTKFWMVLNNATDEIHRIYPMFAQACDAAAELAGKYPDIDFVVLTAHHSFKGQSVVVKHEILK